MEEKRYEWLPHLEGVIPEEASGDKLSMYTIALEGWRRGLPLKFYNIKKGNKVEVNYSFNYQGKDYRFAVSKGEQVKRETMKYSRDKGETKKLLQHAGVSVPEGRVFNKESKDEEILEYAESLAFPVVLKPTNSNLGKGVVPNINSLEELSESLRHVRKELGFEEVIVEQNVSGDEYRVYVLGDQVLGATNRIPANVVGDGKHTIQKLISLKNQTRKKNPNLSSRPIKIDNEVKKHVQKAGYSMDSVPEQDKRVFLREKSNVSSGGDPVDVTDMLTEEVRQVAIDAAAAIPGFVQGGIDIIVNIDKNTAAVIEVNTRPGIGSHLFPMEGKARDIPKAIIDFYFPDTQRQENSKMLYFDFDSVMQLLRSGIAEEMTIPEIPNGKLMVTRFIIGGRVQGVGYRRWVQRKALALGVHGYVKNLESGEVAVIAAGNEGDIEKFHTILYNQEPSRAEVEKVAERKRTNPVKAGFEIAEDDGSTIPELKKKLEEERKKNQKLIGQHKQEIEEIRKQIDKINQRYKAITNSKVWRYSSPARKAAKKVIRRLK